MRQRIHDGFRGILPTLMLYVVAALVIGEIVAFAVLIPLASRVASQSEMGQKARTVQCRLVPVARKVYTDAEVRRVITAEDLRLYTSVFALCPKPKK